MVTKFKSAKQLRMMITGANPTSTLLPGLGLIYSDCWASVPSLCFCVCVCVCAVVSDSVTPQTALCSLLLFPWDFPGKNTGVGCHFLLQGIFPSQGSNSISCVSCIGRWMLLHHCTTWDTPFILLREKQ